LGSSAVLHEFIKANRTEILAGAQTLVDARLAPPATVAELSRGAPMFIDQLLGALAGVSVPVGSGITESSGAHGADLLRAGCSYSQVVHDYGSVCQEVTWLAHKMNLSITPEEFHTLNRCLDDAIAGAVTEFARLREEAIELVESEHVGLLARELRNPLAAAFLTYQVVKTGTLAIGGSTWTELGRNLRRVSALIDRTMARVRLDAGVQTPERLSVFAFIEELEVGAALEASARGLTLSVTPVERGVDVDVDRQLLSAAVANLIQNGLQFTRAGGHIALTSSSTSHRVAIAVGDECGGLPAGMEQRLTRAFAQPLDAGAPLGPGLSIVRQSVLAIGAELRVRDIPGKGCVFTIDLPRRVGPRRQEEAEAWALPGR
jgi:signal transduction histidine kinase